VANKGFTAKNLNSLLKKVGAEIHDVNVDGEVVSKDEALIRTLWNQALGYTERVKNDKGEEIEKKHAPQRWAIDLIYTRREGAVPVAMADVEGRITAAEQVGELAKDRLNNAAKGK
jgi:hypothetical protein